MTVNTKRRAFTLAGIGAIAAAITLHPVTAHADPIPANCERRPWGFLGLTQIRMICDMPLQSDGSWWRTRVIGVPAHYQNATSSCSSGSYYSNCTYYPGGWVEARVDDNETYLVRAGSVLPDEPHHLPNPEPGPPAGDV